MEPASDPSSWDFNHIYRLCCAKNPQFKVLLTEKAVGAKELTEGAKDLNNGAKKN